MKPSLMVKGWAGHSEKQGLSLHENKILKYCNAKLIDFKKTKKHKMFHL